MFPQQLVIKLVTYLIIGLIATFGVYSVYAKIKQIGYDEAEQKYSQIIKDYETNVNKKINSIETLANTLVLENRENSLLLAADVGAILTKVKGKTLTVVKNGECTPSQTFSDTFVEINKRANQSMKDSRK